MSAFDHAPSFRAETISSCCAPCEAARYAACAIFVRAIVSIAAAVEDAVISFVAAVEDAVLGIDTTNVG